MKIESYSHNYIKLGADTFPQCDRDKLLQLRDELEGETYIVCKNGLNTEARDGYIVKKNNLSTEIEKAKSYNSYMHPVTKILLEEKKHRSIFNTFLRNINLPVKNNFRLTIHTFYCSNGNGGDVKPHIDGFPGTCNINIPLKPIFTPISFLDENDNIIDECVYENSPTILNTEAYHGVFNSESERIYGMVKLPIPFEQIYNKLIGETHGT